MILHGWRISNFEIKGGLRRSKKRGTTRTRRTRRRGRIADADAGGDGHDGGGGDAAGGGGGWRVDGGDVRRAGAEQAMRAV